MKKLVKNNEKMPAYIGSDCFDPSYKQGDEKGSESDEDTTTIENSLAPEYSMDIEAPLAGESAIFEELLPYTEVR